ncbi:MAG: CHAT domain-containing protein, partial [Sphingobacteriales bacterium]
NESGHKFKNLPSGKELYIQLVEKVRAKLPDHGEWIIIPDGPLCQLPFESLPIGNNATGMLESIAISYEFSTRSMLQRSVTSAGRDYRVLSFAPFSEITNRNGRWQPLPASLQEVSGVRGAIYSGKQATRKRFLDEINKFPVVHLATHAYADVENPGASFVAFYEGDEDNLETRLYLEELYGLRMDSTQLVIISACETGEGQIASGEGALSLSRGFAYAGAASSVSSLWNADDQSTAFILSKFHQYLRNGYSKPVALQRARLDYIASNDLAKTPNYWSHLILIGDSSPLSPGQNRYFWLYVISGAYISLISVMITRKFLARKKYR